MAWWRIPKRQKDPDEDEIYEFDWTKYLNGSTVASVVGWTVPSGITNYYTSYNTVSTFIGLRGGTLGETYRISCKIQTADTTARKPERSMDIEVQSM
jgi:hypothetical protein